MAEVSGSQRGGDLTPDGTFYRASSRPFLYAYSAKPNAEKTNRIQTRVPSFDCAFKIPLSLSRIHALMRKFLSY